MLRELVGLDARLLVASNAMTVRIITSARQTSTLLTDIPMETSLETVALFSLKLAYEEEGLSPILRDDMVMGDYQKDVFELLVKRGDVESIQFKLNECLNLALDALGGVEKPLGRELRKLSAELAQARSVEQLGQPLLALKGYLRDIL
ncbi:hypothetical protein QE391_000148 [Pseudomonas fluorescens]|nr:hypothetical protein [Pseudomonas fluorescens]